MDYRIFRDLSDIKKYCGQQKISICGVEIIEGAKPIHTQPFVGDTVFMLGNEGSGLNERQIAICDQFVYIP
jgi:tRNA G18 (ribose-2'-O)-methylase SpoU